MLTLLNKRGREIPAKQLTLKRLEQKLVVFKEMERKGLEVVHLVNYYCDVVVELKRYLNNIWSEELKLLSNELTTLLNNHNNIITYSIKIMI